MGLFNYLLFLLAVVQVVFSPCVLGYLLLSATGCVWEIICGIILKPTVLFSSREDSQMHVMSA